MLTELKKQLQKPKTWVAIIIAYIVYISMCEGFVQPSLRSPVGAVTAERYTIKTEAPILGTAGTQAAKLTLVSTNLSNQRRGLLPPVLKGGQTRSSKNIRADIRAVPTKENYGNETQSIWNASDIRPEVGSVKNRYL